MIGAKILDARHAQILLIVATVLFAFDNFILKLSGEVYEPLDITFLSTLMAAPIVTLIFYKELKKPDKKLLMHITVVAFLYFLYGMLNMQSLKHLTVDTASFYFSTSIIMVPLIDLALGTKLKSDKILSILITMGGIYIVYLGSLTHDMVGIMLSIAAAFVRALYIIAQSRLVKEISPGACITSLLWINLILCVIALELYDPGSLLSLDLALEHILPVALFSLTSIVIATTFCITSQKYLTPTRSMITLSLQIVFTIIIAFLLPVSTGFHEDITWNMALGAVLIICGNIVSVGWDNLVKKTVDDGT